MTAPALSLWPGGRPLAITFSFDDGRTQDLRLAALLTRFGLKATFNISTAEIGHNPEYLDKDTLHDPVFAPHEIALHSHTHPFLTALPDAGVYEEMRENRLRLERVSGRIIRGFAYPFGDFDKRVARICRLAGVAYGRTVDATHRFDAPHPGSNWLRWHPTCHEKEWSPDRWDEFCNFRMWHRLPRLLFLWGHSYELDEESGAGWTRIEQLGERAASFLDDKIWAATNLEIHDYLEAQWALQFSANHRQVHNPTRLACWIQSASRAVEVPPGQTVTLEMAE